MIFAYRGIDAQGKKVRSRIEATTLGEAKNKLRSQGILYERIEEDLLPRWAQLTWRRRYTVKAGELAALSRELAMYLRAGITIVNAIKILQTHYKERKKLCLFLKTVGMHLDEGKDFFGALSAQRIVVLPGFFIQSIKVSESGGMLDDVLLELSRFLKEQERIGKEVRGAFAYPSLMLFVALIMVTFMLTFVVPQITGIFAGLDQELPGATRFVIAAGTFVNDHYVAMAVLSGAVGGMMLMAYRYIERFAHIVDRLVMRLPLFGTIVRKSELGRFAYVGALLVRSGIPLVQSVKLSSGILRNRVLKKIFGVAAAKVVEGKRLSTALSESPVHVDEAFVQAVALGEETSQIEPVLFNLSELYFQENRDAIALSLKLLEPLLMLLVGGIIGFIVAAMLLPIFSMSVG